jgi:Spy/CpxP family protein refolding chaperone
MRTKAILTGLMIAVMALSSSIVYADNGGNFSTGDSGRYETTGGGDNPKGEHQWHHGKSCHLMAKALNLTEDQQKQLKDIKQKQRETMKSTFEAIKANRGAFNEEITKATPDMAKITDLQNQLKATQAQMADNQLSSMLQIKKIMTPEQFAGFMALKKERKLMGHKHHQFGAKCAWGKHEGEHKDWSNKGDEGHPSDAE